ncbi:hypothetical protein D3C78_673000 [compost metagenome]
MTVLPVRMEFCTVIVPTWPLTQPRPAEVMLPLPVLRNTLLAMVLLTMLTEPPTLLRTITAPPATVPVAL